MGKGSKKSLKSSLASHQTRLKNKQKAQAAAEHAASLSQKSRSGGPGTTKRKGTNASGNKVTSSPTSSGRPATVPFNATDRVLLIGEGNFSFACALFTKPPSQLQHLPTSNVTATAFDSEDDCFTKYSDARANVQSLRDKGVEVLFDVDATRLEKNSALKGRRWNKIVWNFPHAGKGITDQDRNILSNQRLILDFLRSAANALAKGPVPVAMPSRKRKKPSEDEDEDDDENDGGDAEMRELSADSDEEEGEDLRPADLSSPKSRGSILITLRNQTPYTLWDIPRLAKHPPAPPTSTIKPTPPFVLLRSFVFHRNIWHGYEHRMTKGERANGTGKTGQGGEDRTWEFYLKDVEDLS